MKDASVECGREGGHLGDEGRLLASELRQDQSQLAAKTERRRALECERTWEAEHPPPPKDAFRAPRRTGFEYGDARCRGDASVVVIATRRYTLNPASVACSMTSYRVTTVLPSLSSILVSTLRTLGGETSIPGGFIAPRRAKTRSLGGVASSLPELTSPDDGDESSGHMGSS